MSMDNLDHATAPEPGVLVASQTDQLGARLKTMASGGRGQWELRPPAYLKDYITSSESVPHGHHTCPAAESIGRGSSNHSHSPCSRHHSHTSSDSRGSRASSKAIRDAFDPLQSALLEEKLKLTTGRGTGSWECLQETGWPSLWSHTRTWVLNQPNFLESGSSDGQRESLRRPH